MAAPLWDGRSLHSWGGTEYGGTFDGTPPVGDRLSEAASFGNVKPPGQCSVVQRIICAPGDQYGSSTGWRNLSRESEPIKLVGAGYDTTYTFCIQVPGGFPGDANIYITGLEIHQTNPSGGTGVSPGGLIFGRGQGVELRVAGGPTPQSGGIGNPGRVVSYDQSFPITAQDVWHVFALRWRHGLKGAGGGAVSLWHGQAGLDNSMQLLAEVKDVYTMYAGLSNYPLFGLYRNNTGSTTTTVYAAGWMEWADSGDALNFANQMLGTGSGPPPPPPPPPPATTFRASGNIQTDNALAIGSHEWVVDVLAGPDGKSCAFYKDGAIFDLVQPAQPTRQFKTTLILEGGEKTVGLVVTAVDGQKVSFPAFAVKVPPRPSDSTAKVLAKVAASEFKKTTDSYPAWVKKGKPDTHWAKGFGALDKIQ